MADELIFNKCIFETRISETVGNPYKDNPLGAAAAQLFALSYGFTTNNVDCGLLKRSRADQSRAASSATARAATTKTLYSVFRMPSRVSFWENTDFWYFLYVRVFNKRIMLDNITDMYYSIFYSIGLALPARCTFMLDVSCLNLAHDRMRDYIYVNVS